MKFAQLEVENFLAITDGKVNLGDRGLLLIQGHNHDDTSADSNGSGKSSLADALCWVLYGITARGVSADDVINYDAGKGTRVAVTVVDGSDTYVIERHRKHKTGKNSLKVMKTDVAGTPVDLTKGTDKLTQEVVDKIIGASYEVFKSAVYAGQEQMPDLPAMTDKHLKLLIEEAAGTTELEAAYQEARQRLATAKTNLDTVTGEIVRQQTQEQWLKDQLATAKGALDAFEVNRKQELSFKKAEVQVAVTEAKNLDAQIAAADEPKLRADIAACDAKIASVSGENKKHAELIGKVRAAEAREVVLMDDLNDMKVEVSRAKKELESVQHKVGCPCGECGRPITATEISAAETNLRKKLMDAAENYKEAKEALEEGQKSSQELTSELQTFEASMTDLSAETHQRASLQAQIDALVRLQSERQKVAQRAKIAGEAFKKKQVEPNPHEATLEKLKNDLAAIQTQQASLLQNQQEAAGEVELADEAAKVFAPAGVRAHILDEVTPFLNQQTAQYLSTLSDGNIEANWTTLVRNGKGELREKFSIEVENGKGAKSFAGLSGGEKRKVRISTALSLQDLVATRAIKPIDLFIGDEIDDALDQSGLERLMEILEEKAKERGSVFVVSHRSLRDWISQVLMVEKQNGKTFITETIV